MYSLLFSRKNKNLYYYYIVYKKGNIFLPKMYFYLFFLYLQHWSDKNDIIDNSTWKLSFFEELIHSFSLILPLRYKVFTSVSNLLNSFITNMSNALSTFIDMCLCFSSSIEFLILTEFQILKKSFIPQINLFWSAKLHISYM
jgi:hypothetical protein